MPDPITSADAAALQRRGFLRGGALLAAVAGGAVASTAGGVLPASASSNFPRTVNFPVPAERLLDTRSSEGLKAIVASSDGALDSKNRLRGGAWIEVAIMPTGDSTALQAVAVFVNLKGLKSTKGGSLVVSQPDKQKPTGTTVTYSKGLTVTNSAFVGLGTTKDFYTVQIWATSTTHLTLDVTGIEIYDGSSTLNVLTSATATRVLQAVRAVPR